MEEGERERGKEGKRERKRERSMLPTAACALRRLCLPKHTHALYPWLVSPMLNNMLSATACVCPRTTAVA